MDGTPLALPDCEFVGKACDLIRSRNAAMTDADVMKLATRQFVRMHEPVRGAWRKRPSLKLGGPRGLVITLK